MEQCFGSIPCFRTHTCTLTVGYVKPLTNQPCFLASYLHTQLLLPAVVLVLSEEFMSASYPMKVLQLLLERHSRNASKALLLPVPCSVEWEEVEDMATEYKAAIGPGADQHCWLLARYLEELRGLAIDDVRSHPKVRDAAHTCRIIQLSSRLCSTSCILK
jgi:hypothetical protein